MSDDRNEPTLTDAAVGSNGGYAQVVYFAKSRDRPKVDIRVCGVEQLLRAFLEPDKNTQTHNSTERSGAPTQCLVSGM